MRVGSRKRGHAPRQSDSRAGRPIPHGAYLVLPLAGTVVEHRADETA